MSPTATSVADSRRAQANRENARKSTGPRTPAGLSRAAQNARTHGGFARRLLLPNEDLQAYYQHYSSLYASLNPKNAMQIFLAQRIIALAWRLNRLADAETHVHFTRIATYQQRLEKLSKSPDAQKLDPALRTLLEDDAPPDGFILGQEYDTTQDPRHNAFDRLGAAEQRLAGQLHRALRDLQALQKNHDPAQEDDLSNYFTPADLAAHLGQNDDDDDQEDDEAPTPNAPPPQPAAPTSNLQNEAKGQSVTPAPATPRTTKPIPDPGRPTPLTAAINATLSTIENSRGGTGVPPAKSRASDPPGSSKSSHGNNTNPSPPTY